MATSVRKIDLRIGELVEVDGQRYEVVADPHGGFALEPPVTPTSQLHAERGTSPATDQEFEDIATDLPHDAEG